MTAAPIVLVPGAWTRAAAFHAVREQLEAGGHPTTVPELPARAARLPQLDRGGLRAIDAVIDEALDEHPEPPVLAGHSLGGLVALRAARRRRVRALVLLMPAPPTGLLGTVLPGLVRHPYNALRLVGSALSVTTGLRLGLPAPDGIFSAEASPETLARSAAYRVDESWSVLAALLIGSRDPVRPTGVPTLVVAGRQDGITPTGSLRPLAEALGAPLVELDVAHNFNEEPTSGLVTDAVLEFLRARVGEERPGDGGS